MVEPQHTPRKSLAERRKVLMHWLLEQHLAHSQYGFVEWRECESCHNPYTTWRSSIEHICLTCQEREQRKKQRGESFASRIRRELELIWKLCGR